MPRLRLCRFHPTVSGIGVCVRCRTIVCGPCRTRVDGVNHCHACLAELAAPPGRDAAGGWVGRGAALAGAAAACGALAGLLWLAQGAMAP